MTLTNSHAPVQAYDFDSGVFGLDFVDAADLWHDALTDPLTKPLTYTYFTRQADCLAVLLVCAPLLVGRATLSSSTTSARTHVGY